MSREPLLTREEIISRLVAGGRLSEEEMGTIEQWMGRMENLGLYPGSIGTTLAFDNSPGATERRMLAPKAQATLQRVGISLEHQQSKSDLRGGWVWQEDVRGDGE